MKENDRKKLSLCNDLGLIFKETKQQVLVALWSKGCGKLIIRHQRIRRIETGVERIEVKKPKQEQKRIVHHNVQEKNLQHTVNSGQSHNKVINTCYGPFVSNKERN